MCIGVDTALNTIVEAVDKLRDTASSHNRAFLVEVMGRNSGYLALIAGIIGGAEMVLTPEDEARPEEVAQAIEEAYKRGKTHAIIMVAEGAPIRVTDLAHSLESMDIGFSTRVTILGHIQRGGKPSAFDRWLATRMGVRAVEFLLTGQTDFMTGLDGRDIVPVPLMQVTENRKALSSEYLAMGRMLAR
jgi:6-phosphofructokinase 1